MVTVEERKKGLKVQPTISLMIAYLKSGDVPAVNDIAGLVGSMQAFYLQWRVKVNHTNLKHFRIDLRLPIFFYIPLAGRFRFFRTNPYGVRSPVM